MADLKLTAATATAAEREAIDEVLGPPPIAVEALRYDLAERVVRGGAELRRRRHQLLPALHALDARVGWISRGAVEHLAARLDVAPAEIHGVASFYGMFSTAERPTRRVEVCVDLACRVAGGPSGDELPAGCHAAPCLGLCERAPAVLVRRAGEHPSDQVGGPVDPDDLPTLVGGHDPGGEPPVEAACPQITDAAGRDPSLVLLGGVGRADPTDLDAYRARGGYEALRRAIELGPGRVIAELSDSGLVGRGGAAFPTGRKWDAVARQPARPHHLVCNADESEPGTFKDRVLMEGDPFAVLEAMTIAGVTIGAEHGWIYLRGEYPRARRALERAIRAARERDLLGDDVLGSGLAFDVTIFRGAGAYICGEETAIFNSIEGHRGEPRNKPPYPTEAGLFGKPTLVNNVETLVDVLPIVRHGGLAHAALGTEDSSGRKLFCVSGAVRRPGVIEVELGATLRQVLDLAGGLDPDRPLRAVLLGGAAGGFVGPDELDLPLTFEATRAAGVTLGSGVVMAIDHGTDLVELLVRIAEFFRDESCGQCVPCRIGTVRQHELLRRVRGRSPEADELATLRDLAQVMRDASICGLGQTAASAIESAIDRLEVFS